MLKPKMEINNIGEMCVCVCCVSVMCVYGETEAKSNKTIANSSFVVSVSLIVLHKEIGFLHAIVAFFIYTPAKAI